MKNTFKPVVASVIALLMFLPAAFAQTPETSTLPVTEPLDVGGTILQPGEYLIRVIPNRADRNKVQITSKDMKTIYATVLTVPHQLEPNEEVPNTTFVYFPAGEGSPRALRTWFAPHPEASQGGHDIVYEASRARQLARLVNEPVTSYPDETAVAELETTEFTVITPEPVQTEVAVTTPAPTIVETQPAPVIETPEPMVSSQPAPVDTSDTTESDAPEMPSTASRVPLFALLGLASLAGALALRVTRS